MDIGIARPHKLYNAGDRISETMAYSLPDGHDIHCTARWRLEAPAHSFFEVPQELRVGEARIAVNFLEVIMRDDRLGRRGVIWVDANWKRPEDAEEAEKVPVAASDKEAVAKGERLWKAHLLAVAQAHIDQCNQIRAAGGVPLAAQGFTKRALREVGFVDPSEAVLIAAQASKANEGELAELKEQLAEQGKLIKQLLAGKAHKENTDKPATDARSR